MSLDSRRRIAPSSAPARPAVGKPGAQRAAASEVEGSDRNALLRERRRRQTDLATLDRVIGLLDHALADERQSRADSRVAAFKLERVRQSFAYRLGQCVVHNLRSPRRWWRLPGDLWSLYRDRSARGLPAAGSQASSDDANPFREGRMALGARPHWQPVVLPSCRVDTDLWVTALMPADAPDLQLRVEAEAPDLRTQLREAFTPDINHPSATVMLRAATPLRLLVQPQGGIERLRCRTLDTRRCVLMFERRATARPPARRRPAADTAVEDEPEPVATAPRDDAPRALSDSEAEAVVHAYEQAAGGDLDAAIAHLKRYARGGACHTVHLFEANREREDELQWLSRVNAYLKPFGVTPVELEPGDTPRFLRLRARAPVTVARGPRVSVLMPAYQAERTLRMAAGSILGQSWQPLELIIVDDCSDDATWTMAQELARSDERVRAFRTSRNAGPYVAKNLALQVATGEYVTGHDADDWAHPQRLERHLDAVLRSAGRIAGSVTGMLRVDADGRFTRFSRQHGWHEDGALRMAAMSTLFETASMRATLGFWDGIRFGADTEMIERARRVYGDRFVSLRQFSMFCLDGESSLTNDPTHGISRVHGVSPSRREYREQYERWHRTLSPPAAVLPFPHLPRRFPAPDAARVADDDLREVRLR